MFEKSIAPLAITVTLALGASGAPTQADAFQRISMEEAKERCFVRARRYASNGVGPSGRERSDYEIQSLYKRCIYGYTGQKARDVPVIPRRY